ncbi:permease prefix domain 1-containing protein [Arthrobacter sp.]|uniref:permease prefix domain 1-containing protein n=1 Tax=Arthrobacter sp. TaxID=1667 RepID=UPI00258D0557|nr:permease prefix domain 1-containing protein [Arthrobacter sp.]
MSGAGQSNIHRHLDEAFAGLAMTPELQDLKEEIRSNLSARVDELRQSGATDDEAAATAITELGDIGELIRQESAGEVAEPVSPGVAQVRDYARNRVRPNSGFVTGAVLLSVLAVASLLLFVMVLGPSGNPGMAVLSGLVLAVSVGVTVCWSLRQETSHNYPVPLRRALSYGAAAAAGVVGLALCALVTTAGTGMLAAGVFVVLGSVVGFIRLGISQTNRRKPWVREVQRGMEGQDRFSQDPAAAARFGMYVGALWIAALAVFAVLTFTVGIAWSWLAILAALAATMVILARMLFPAGGADTATGPAAPRKHGPAPN